MVMIYTLCCRTLHPTICQRHSHTQSTIFFTVFYDVTWLLSFLSVVRSRLLFHTPALSIVPLLMLILSCYDFDGPLQIWVNLNTLLLLFIVTIIVLLRLLTMMSSMDAPSTLRMIIILFVIIFRVTLFFYDLSPLQNNQQTSTKPLVALLNYLTNSSWFLLYHLKFEGWCCHILCLNLCVLHTL